MNTKLYDSELKVMEVLWKEGDDSAKHISEILNAEIGWNKNTTYTVIKKCVAKGAIERYGSNYMCKPLPKRMLKNLKQRNSLINCFTDQK